jgi:hypothetical protein
VVALIVAFAVGASTWPGIVLLAIAVIKAGTAAAGFCPLYRVLGLRTNKTTADIKAGHLVLLTIR